MTEQKEVKKRRPKGEGSIFQRQDGSWCGKVTIGGKIKYFYGAKRQEVFKKINDFKAQQKLSQNPSEKYFDDYIKDWLYNVKINEVKPLSFDRLESTILTHITPYIGQYKVLDITPDLIREEIINTMVNKELSHSSVKKAYDALKACFTFARVNQHILVNPMGAVTLPKQENFEKKDIHFLTEDEVKKFSQTCMLKYTNNERRYTYGEIFITMIYTGVRAGEMLALKWDDVDFEHQMIYIRGNMALVKDRSEDITGETSKRVYINQQTAKSKSSTNREIPMNPKVVEALSSFKRVQEEKLGKLSKYVVCKDDGLPIHLSTFKKSFDKIISKAGFEKCGLHTLRHTFASMAFKKGIDVKTVSELLGHADVTITYNTYIHLIKEQKREAVNLIENL